MFKKIQDIWTDKGFEILFVISIVIFISIGIYNWVKGKKGSWSKKDWEMIKNIKSNGGFIPNRYTNNIDTNITNNSTKQPRGDSKGELECRRVLRKLFGRPFNKCRPNFLKNSVLNNNQNLELDCFDKIVTPNGRSVLLGVEYHGKQHYEYIPFFHGKNRHTFENQKYRDYLKKMLCEKNGVLLIEVPYTIKVDHIERYLIGILEKYNII